MHDRRRRRAPSAPCGRTRAGTGRARSARPPGRSRAARRRCSRPCSSSFDLTSPSVSRVAQHLADAHLAQQVRQRADVVLVRVREHDGAAPRGRSQVRRSRAGRGRRRGARRAGTRARRRRRASRPPISKTVMFLPTSPRPPSGITRSTESVIGPKSYGEHAAGQFVHRLWASRTGVYKSPFRGWHGGPAGTRTTCMRSEETASAAAGRGDAACSPPRAARGVASDSGLRGDQQPEPREAVADLAELVVGRRHERQPVAADVVAEQVERGLDRDRVRRDPRAARRRARARASISRARVDVAVA